MRLPGSGRDAGKALAEADDDAGNAAVAHQQVGAEADDGHGKVGWDAGEEVGEVGFIGRREQHLRRSADAEPRDVGQLGAGGDAPAQVRQPGLEVGADIGKRQRRASGSGWVGELHCVGAAGLFRGEPIG